MNENCKKTSSCGVLLNKAEDIRIEAMDLYEAGQFDKLRELLTIDSDVWSGYAANNYALIVEQICCENSENADWVKSALYQLPEALIEYVRNVKRADWNLARYIRERYAGV